METPIGRVSHYWPMAHAAALDLETDIRVGDRVRIRGHGRDFVQHVTSLEIDHARTREAHPGDPAALRVRAPVHEGDEVLKVLEEPHWSVASGRYAT